MSDSETKPKAGVPSWQLPKGADAEEKKTDDIPETQADGDEPSRTELVESAKKFLEEDEVKDATTDKKIVFLESKGLKNEEVEQLLGVARNVEASNPAPKPPRSKVTPAQQPLIPPTTTSREPPTQPQAAPKPHSDTPPIITYPEFLITPQAPPPLITPSRILNTLYAFGSLGALIYGASTYLVKPMSESLASARHELAETAREKLDTLNEKLKPLVSEVPQPDLAHGEAYRDRDYHDSDDDPTEMFHRDIGVQTTDELETIPVPVAKPALVNTQTAKATLISTNLTEIDTAISSQSHGDGQIQTEINNLKEYLDKLMERQPSFTYGSGQAYGVKKDEDDEIGRLKKEIRAVKGVLLSAKTFPGASGAGAHFKRTGIQA